MKEGTCCLKNKHKRSCIGHWEIEGAEDEIHGLLSVCVSATTRDKSCLGLLRPLCKSHLTQSKNHLFRNFNLFRNSSSVVGYICSSG